MLIGPNNVGKTTVLKAYETFRNSGAPLAIDDFYQSRETNPVEIAGIFNDFLGLYTGKIQTGIRPLIEKYKNHPMLMGLLSNLDEAAKIQAPKAMKEIYSFYKEYRGRDLEDADWKELTEKARQICAGWEENEWVRRIVLEMISLLDSDDAERRRIALEVEKEMEEAMQNDKAA